jgi:arylsulfatase A-like enzyme
MPASESQVTIEGEAIRIASQTGLAQAIPVEGSDPIALSVKGDFRPETGLRAVLVQLTAPEALPNPAAPGALRELIKNHGRETCALTTSDDGSMASILYEAPPGIKGLILMVQAEGTEAGTLHWARIDDLSPKELWLLKRKRTGIDHPAMAQPVLDATVRPSFLLIPRTAITFQETRVPASGRFRCAFGVRGRYRQALKAVLTANEPAGETHEIFREHLNLRPETWIHLERDLSRLSGRVLTFKLTVTWAGAQDPVQSPPLVFFGAPMLYSSPEPLDEARDRKKYNVIIVSLDTLRADRLGCYGNPLPVSPAIDRLAAGSTLFECVYAHAPYTHSSHASLFSSLYPSAHGVLASTDSVPAELTLLPEILAREGWMTASFNGGGYVSHEFGFHQGFDLYCEVDPLGDQYTLGKPLAANRFTDGSRDSLNRALAWVESMRAQRFFLFLHTFIVHDYLPPESWAEVFNKDCPGGLEASSENVRKVFQAYFEDCKLEADQLQFMNNMYNATIRAADDMVAELVHRLTSLDLLEKTVLVISSDHGEEFLEHGFLAHGKAVYDESIRVPLIIRVPGMAGGNRVKTRVGQVDLLPSLLELLKIEGPETMQGRSFLPLMRGESGPNRTILSEVKMPRISDRACIISDGWKFIEGSMDESLYYKPPAPERLYYLPEDPGEKNNRINSHPEEAERLRALLRKMQEGAKDVHESFGAKRGGAENISEELKRLLKEQGYL